MLMHRVEQAPNERNVRFERIPIASQRKLPLLICAQKPTHRARARAKTSDRTIKAVD